MAKQFQIDRAESEMDEDIDIGQYFTGKLLLISQQQYYHRVNWCHLECGIPIIKFLSIFYLTIAYMATHGPEPAKQH